MRRLGLSFFILLITVPALAIDAVVSHTVFYRPDASGKAGLTPYVEISWQVNPNTLHYETSAGNTISGKIKADIILSADSGVINHDTYILQTIPVRKIDEIVQHSIIDLRRYNVPAGRVTLKFILTDVADSANRFAQTDTFTVRAAGDKYFFSGLQLLDTAYGSSVQSPFLKDGMQHVPLSTNFMDDKRTMFYYYGELYSTGGAAGTANPLVLKAAISKSESDGFYGKFVKTDTVVFQQPSMHTLGRFDIATLPSGNYYLRIWLEDNHHDVLAAESQFFQRLNKHKPPPDTSKATTALADTGMENVQVLNLKKTFVAKYSLAQIRGILKMLLPFSDPAATRTINGFLKKPDELYMRYYVYNYFAGINKEDPGRAWKSFAEKITEVNKLFNAGSTPGYQTERGFIYLRYGPPTDIIPVENERGALPYEIWQYNALTQTNHKDIPDAVFLFYRPNELSDDYRLLHSNVEGEVQNPGWRSVLFNNSGGSSSESRAEQYIGNK